MKFTVVLHTDDGAHDGVIVPDLPGCFSGGQDIPPRQPIAVHQSNPDDAGGVWAVVDVPVEKYLGPAEKVNISIPRRLLARIDAYARAHGATRSGFLADAARRAMRG